VWGEQRKKGRGRNLFKEKKKKTGKNLQQKELNMTRWNLQNKLDLLTIIEIPPPP